LLHSLTPAFARPASFFLQVDALMGSEVCWIGHDHHDTSSTSSGGSEYDGDDAMDLGTDWLPEDLCAYIASGVESVETQSWGGVFN